MPSCPLYNQNQMASARGCVPKAVAVRGETYEFLKRLKRRMGTRTFKKAIELLTLRELRLERNMFNVDRGKSRPFSLADSVGDRR